MFNNEEMTPVFSCDVPGCQAPGGTLQKTRHSLATHKRLKHGITDSRNVPGPSRNVSR